MNDPFLLDIFPNPLQGNSIVRYDLLKASKIKISLYDITGKEISNITDKFHEPGIYEYQHDKSEINLQQRLYMLVLDWGNGSKYQKVIKL